MGSSAQKVSVRLKPIVMHKAVQTDASSSDSEIIGNQAATLGKIKADTSQLSPNILPLCPSPIPTRRRPCVKWENMASFHKPKGDDFSKEHRIFLLEKVQAQFSVGTYHNKSLKRQRLTKMSPVVLTMQFYCLTLRDLSKI